MLSARTRVILIVLLLCVLYIIIQMVKKRKLELKYVLVWLVSDLALIVLVCFPQLINYLAMLLGIYDPMNMIFFVGFLLALVIIFSLTMALSRTTAKVRRIAQALAILSDEKNVKEKSENIDG